MLAVRDIMTKEVMTFEITTPVQIIISSMIQNNFGCAIILDQGRLAGIITERDVMRKLVFPNKRLNEVTLGEIMMAGNLVSITPDHTIIEAAKLMKTQKIKYLPVVLEGKMFTGLVTQTDIVHNLEHMMVVF